MSRVAERAQRLAGAFREQAGSLPDGVWAAPGRVNLVGEHTDYNEGFVLPAAVDREVLAAVRLRDDGLVTCRSLDLPGEVTARVDALGPGCAQGWSAYVLGVVWALREAGLAVPGLDVVVASDVPVGAGLSSSAGLEAAVCLALVELLGADLDRTAMAIACRRAETDVVGAPVGVMDQMASLHGREGAALLLDCRSLEVRPVPLGLDAAGVSLLVVDTRVHHAHATGEYAHRRATCEQAAAALGVPALRDASLAEVQQLPDGDLRRCARHVVTEDDRVLAVVQALEGGDLAEVGRLFAASHASMRDDFRISCHELDLAVGAALAGGALAARMTGGGFGGCVAALVPVGAEAEVERAVTAAAAGAGVARPDVFVVRPSDGAARVA
ncbi:MAG: galactokinase [Frankiales bacterium]|nr:galactokinase [Frankiales bacterium]